MRNQQTGDLNNRSEGKKLRDQIAKEKGSRFRRAGFFAVDKEGRILEKAFPENRETVQVHLSKYGKVQRVFLLKD
jgi:hypothetical protein